MTKRAVFFTTMAAVTVAAATAVRSAGSAAAAPACTTSRLVVWLDTQGSGTAGSTYYKLRFTNLSGHACTLRGYPGVSAVDLAGRRLGNAASRNTVRPIPRIRLRNGGTATAVLRIVDTLNIPRARCRPTTAAGLRVYPPNQFASKVVPFPFRACSRTGVDYLTVEVVR
jgi:hypothetical protein